MSVFPLLRKSTKCDRHLIDFTVTQDDWDLAQELTIGSRVKTFKVHLDII
jgi:hypothetical protein